MSEHGRYSTAATSRVLRASGVVALLLAAVSFLAYTLARSPSAVGGTLLLLLVGASLMAVSWVVRARGRAEPRPGEAST